MLVEKWLVRLRNFVMAHAMSEPVTMTVRELLQLDIGLRQLDAVRTGDSEKSQLVPLEFAPKVSLKLAQCAAATAKARMAFDTADRKAAEEAGYFEGMDKTEANARKADAYLRARQELFDEEVSVEGLQWVHIEDLLLKPQTDEEKKKGIQKRNLVPQSVLNRLAPILRSSDEG